MLSFVMMSARYGWPLVLTCAGKNSSLITGLFAGLACGIVGQELVAEIRIAKPTCRLRLIVVAALGVITTVCIAGCGVASDPPAAVTRNETVVLLPALSAGDAGWCLLALPSAVKGEDGCSTTRTGYPIVAETWGTSAARPETDGLDVVSSKVTAVSFDGGAPLPTKPESFLPDHLRAVAWAIRGQTPAMAGSPFHPTPLDVHGRALRQRLYPPSRSIGGHGLLFVVPNQKVVDAADSPRSPCVIKERHRSGLVVEGAYVVNSVKAYGGLIGEAFLACFSAEYSFDRWPMEASVLIGAAHPYAASPPLPLMKAVRGRKNVFEEPGQLGPQVARRVRNGWLVVWGGKTQAQRLRLLEDLQATGPRYRSSS